MIQQLTFLRTRPQGKIFIQMLSQIHFITFKILHNTMKTKKGMISLSWPTTCRARQMVGLQVLLNKLLDFSLEMQIQLHTNKKTNIIQVFTKVYKMVMALSNNTKVVSEDMRVTDLEKMMMVAQAQTQAVERAISYRNHHQIARMRIMIIVMEMRPILLI